MTRPPRLFTPHEATRTLPLVRSIVADILVKQRQLSDLVVLKNPDDEQKELVAALSDEIRACTAELTALGCEYKGLGFEEGRVDFPGEIDGQEVFLCWKTGEARLEWYHSYDEGFAGRKRIPSASCHPDPAARTRDA